MSIPPPRASADDLIPEAQNMLTVAEVARMLRVSKMTVYRLVHDGELPSYQVGRSFRIPVGVVRQYLADNWGAQHEGV